jgi:integrase
MLRPSDIAPRSVHYDVATDTTQRRVFSTDQVIFNPDGSLSVYFHGIKNDYQRDGFTVTLPPTEDVHYKIDPIVCLRCYIDKTDSIRQLLPDRPVFVTLRAPYRAIDSSTVSGILYDSISAAGLKGKGYTAKNFRPTGATCAINNGINPDIARHIGRWRSSDTFEKHYVHTKVPASYITKLSSHQ